MKELRWSTPPSPRLAARSGMAHGLAAGLGLSAVLLAGCDTLKARAIAQDGVEKYKDGEVKSAAELFDKAASIDPTVPAIQINRGFCWLTYFQQNPKGKEGQEAAQKA